MQPDGQHRNYTTLTDVTQFSKGTIGRLNDYVHGRLSEDEMAGPLVAADGLEHGPQADFIMKLRCRYDRSW